MMFKKFPVLAVAALAFVPLASSDAAVKYTPPSSTHYCVGLDVNGQKLPPGKIQWEVTPATSPERWFILRYPDGLGGYTALRGTDGMHTTDYFAALADLGYETEQPAVQDAYCTQDEEVLERAQAVRLSGQGCPTPFEPGVWSWRRRGWSTTAWRVFVDYNRGALAISLGSKEAANRCAAIILEQVADAERVCKIGQGHATSPAAGNWRADGYGVCRPTAWSRPGTLTPEWARPIRIEIGDRELGLSDDGPGRESTGFLDTDLVRKAPGL